MNQLGDEREIDDWCIFIFSCVSMVTGGGCKFVMDVAKYCILVISWTMSLGGNSLDPTEEEREKWKKKEGRKEGMKEQKKKKMKERN